MKLRTISTVLLFTLIILLISCDPSSANKQIIKPVLSMPDQIIIHNKDKSQTLDKNNDIYDKVLELTNSRFHDKLSTALDIIDENNADALIRDGIGIEFIYSKEQDFSVKNEDTITFKYYKLYFQLTSEKYGDSQGSPVHTLIHADKNKYTGSSIGPLNYSKELIDLVESGISKSFGIE